MADAVGARQAFFSTCGSSLSVKAAMLAVAGGQGDLLISRDAHKSVVAGLVFGGMQPQWIRPRYDDRLHLAHPPSPQDVARAWEEHPGAAGALIVSPTPYGTCADISAIAGTCHQRGKPLIVDEAWGAHLPFHPELPTWAMDAGADVCVVSVHKMGTGFEQGSVFHLSGDLVDPDQLSACADMLMTTSPNVLVYAALDGWRRQMAEHGRAQLDAGLGAGDLTGCTCWPCLSAAATASSASTKITRWPSSRHDATLTSSNTTTTSADATPATPRAAQLLWPDSRIDYPLSASRST
jgi:lysine decarboxylase